MKRHPHRWQRVAFVLAVASVATTMVDAAGNWPSKPFNTWTDMELTGVVTRSPWAGKASIVPVSRRFFR